VKSLGRLLSSEPDFDVVGQCGTAQEALEFLGRAPVELVLLDFNLPDLQGDEVVRLARGAGLRRQDPCRHRSHRGRPVVGGVAAGRRRNISQAQSGWLAAEGHPHGGGGRRVVDRQVIQFLAARAPIAADRNLQNALTEREEAGSGGRVGRVD